MLSSQAILGTPINISIPWHFNDWRRVTNENAYIYLPFVGTVALPSGSINQATSITVIPSYCCSDGSITYTLRSSNGDMIGTYGSKVGAEYPIGIMQGHSAYEQKQALLSFASFAIPLA